ncbi:RES domain-containing protein [Sarcina ventriculi]|uniref:RES domain-containing protein n=1 Tax=Sarcina ventriculi TaxID=1267 RepID=UPI001C0F7E98|nr:RES family NAD+ phosphorylase [Sarcina ventriculi]
MREFWEDFKEDLRYKNSYFSGEAIFKILDKIPDKLQPPYHPLSFVTLYRATKEKWANSRDVRPPKGVASARRCNPEGISSFYMASNEETAIKEIRIRYNDDITLAEIEINNNFYIWNFNFYEYENLGVLLRRNLNLET